MRNAILFFMLVCFVGCYEEKMSGIMTEKAKIVNKHYEPESIEITTSFDPEDGTVSIDTDTIPPEWTVSFACGHGSFTISSKTNPKAYEVYNKWNIGTELTVLYREVFYSKKMKDGSCHVIHKGYSFVDAQEVALEIPSPETEDDFFLEKK